MENQIVDEYIIQIHEYPPERTRIYKKAENIIRGYNCIFLEKLKEEKCFCKYFNMEVTPNCYCCWAKEI